jgi:hypothetical protein
MLPCAFLCGIMLSVAIQRLRKRDKTGHKLATSAFSGLSIVVPVAPGGSCLLELQPRTAAEVAMAAVSSGGVADSKNSSSKRRYDL